MHVVEGDLTNAKSITVWPSGTIEQENCLLNICKQDAADVTRAIIGDSLDVLIASAGLISDHSAYRTFTEL